jgi:ATP-dependent DNA helicase RecG
MTMYEKYFAAGEYAKKLLSGEAYFSRLSFFQESRLTVELNQDKIISMELIELKSKLDQFRALPLETEWLEFKEAKSGLDFNKIGKYFSALCNEANLKNKPYGWLILGIEDKSRRIVGTNYRRDKVSLDKLKSEIAEKTNGRITFVDIHELQLPQGRVIMFQIPPAPQGIPVSWEGHYYGRDGETLCPLNIHEIEQIRGKSNPIDWSEQIVEEASIRDLDMEALAHAKLRFKERNKNQSFSVEIDKWDTVVFLDKARLTINGKITNTAIILLGKPESTHYLSPAVARVSWKLDSTEQAFEHFDPPFLLNTNKVYQRIRNIKYKLLPAYTLFPIEVDKYDPWVILEALHNCIAHQDYKQQSRINVIEKIDELFFINAGNFFDGTIDDYTMGDKTPEKYRNYFLAQAMVNLGMIETMGYGIKRMYLEQKKRYFPMPEFDLNSPEHVKLKIIGKVIDENYTKTLIDHTDLTLETVIYLDKVQKKKTINKEAAQKLKKQNLVEGRYPNLFVAPEIASITEEKSRYIKNRAFDKSHYKKMVSSYIEKFGHATRDDINNLLLDKLSDILNEDQKIKKIDNLLQEMSQKDKIIKNIGNRKKPTWTLVKYSLN